LEREKITGRFLKAVCRWRPTDFFGLVRLLAAAVVFAYGIFFVFKDALEIVLKVVSCS